MNKAAREGLILASSSPRRKELLALAKIPFVSIAADVDEASIVGESASEMVRRLALLKASTVALEHPQQWVLGADTTVELDGEIFAKPRDAQDALSMLTKLQGRRHNVFTGFCVTNHQNGIEEVRCIKTEVQFIEMGQSQIRAYVETGECMDKAGAYAFQGLGSLMIRSVTGSVTNVIGLPIAEVIDTFCELGVSFD